MTARVRGALMQRAVAAASQGARVTGQARRCMYRSDVSKRIDSFCGISGPDGPISGRGQLGEHAPGVFCGRACQIWAETRPGSGRADSLAPASGSQCHPTLICH